MSGVSYLEKKLAKNEIILLDGATGTELEKRGVPMNSKAWSAEAIITHPKVVQAVHEEYISAGADVIICNSFSLAKHMLSSAGLENQFLQLNRDAALLAVQARDAVATTPVTVAGSISPSVFDSGKSFSRFSLDEARENYREQAHILVDAGADLLIIEMIEDIEQGAMAIEGASSTGLPVWLGFSCKRDDTGKIMLWGGQHSLSEGLESLTPLGGSAAFIMHTDVADTTDAFSILKSQWQGTLGVYAHSGMFVMPNWIFNDIISPKEYAMETSKWLSLGAQIIGGCCGIGPNHIRALKSEYFS